jgi:hypothetical protein
MPFFKHTTTRNSYRVLRDTHKKEKKEINIERKADSKGRDGNGFNMDRTPDWRFRAGLPGKGFICEVV